MKKKIFFSVLVLIFSFAAAETLRIKMADAALPMAWLWGGSEAVNDSTINGNESGVGWISLNGANSGSGGGTYAVNIPAGGGDVKGYAWSSNLGYIDFDPQDHCTTTAPIITGDQATDQYQAASCDVPAGFGSGKGGVTLNTITNKLNGWARVVDIAKASAKNNSGGWAGWIQMQPGFDSSYGVSYDPVTGKLSGNAWSGEGTDSQGNILGLGVISFDAQQIEAPTVAITAPSIDVANNNAPWTVKIDWHAEGATSCVKSGSTDPNWNNKTVTVADPTGAMSENVSQSVQSVTYTLTCTGAGGTTAASVTVGAFCYDHVCGSDGICAAKAYPAINAATCTHPNDCTIGDASTCETRRLGVWREVAP